MHESYGNGKRHASRSVHEGSRSGLYNEGPSMIVLTGLCSPWLFYGGGRLYTLGLLNTLIDLAHSLFHCPGLGNTLFVHLEKQG